MNIIDFEVICLILNLHRFKPGSGAAKIVSSTPAYPVTDTITDWMQFHRLDAKVGLRLLRPTNRGSSGTTC